MADPIRLLILKNIETTLADIKIANGYFTDNEIVRRFKSVAMKMPGYPAINIIVPEEDPAPPKSQLLYRDMTVGLEAWIRSHENLPDAIEYFYADIEKAMMADTCRGGHAINTTLGPSAFNVGDEAGQLGKIDVDFIVQYRFLKTDPTSPG